MVYNETSFLTIGNITPTIGLFEVSFSQYNKDLLFLLRLKFMSSGCFNGCNKDLLIIE